MDAHQSNLSAGNYGYDMVVATTQNAINNSMKQWLAAITPVQINVCYAYDDSGTLVQADYDTLVKQAGIDPYSIASGAYHKTDPVAKLDDAGFAFAFRVTTGAPKLPSPSLPDIVVLDKGNAIVTYQLYCSEFSILNLSESGGGANLNWVNLCQPADKPWIFRINVKLGMRDDAGAFAQLPQQVKDAVQNLNPDSAFSLQQLYLDLNSISLDSLPVIAGLDPQSNAATYLTKIFINTYFAKLPPGDVILGYAVKPQTYHPGSSASPSVIPTDLNIEISPALTASGDANPQDQGMYTLNYLVMTANNKMPAPVQFTWNWVEDGQQSVFDGVMAVNRLTFASYISDRLSTWLPQICIQPHVQLTWQGLNLQYGFSASNDGGLHNYTINPTGAKVLSFSYGKDSGDQAGLNGDMGTLYVSYNVSSDVTFTNRQIIITTTSTFYMDVSALSAHARGNPLKYQATLIYNAGIDASGNIIITPSAPVIQDLSDNVNSDVWGSIINFFSGGAFQNLINSIGGALHADSFALDSFDNYIKGALQNNNFWVFPGSSSFRFTDVFFSDYQDLVTPVVYANRNALFSK